MDLSVDAFDSYLSRVRAPATRLKYVDAANRFLLFVQQRKLAFDALPPRAMGDFVEWLQQKHGLAPRSVQVYVAGARSYLRWCEGHGLSLPHLHADTPRAEAPVPNALRNEALTDYLRASSRIHEPYRTALLLLPYTGLRSNELASLSMSKSIRVIALPVRGGNGHRDHVVFVVRGKGGVVRLVPVLLDGVPIFFDYMKRWRQHVAGDSDWLFPGQGGMHIATRTLRHHCARIREVVPGNGKLTPHVLRDTYTTALWKSGVDIPTITKVLGHKDVKTTYAHYLDVQDSDVLESIVKQDARLVMTTPSSVGSNAAVSYLRNLDPKHRPR